MFKISALVLLFCIPFFCIAQHKPSYIYFDVYEYLNGKFRYSKYNTIPIRGTAVYLTSPSVHSDDPNRVKLEVTTKEFATGAIQIACYESDKFQVLFPRDARAVIPLKYDSESINIAVVNRKNYPNIEDHSSDYFFAVIIYKKMSPEKANEIGHHTEKAVNAAMVSHVAISTGVPFDSVKQILTREHVQRFIKHQSKNKSSQTTLKIEKNKQVYLQDISMLIKTFGSDVSLERITAFQRFLEDPWSSPNFYVDFNEFCYRMLYVKKHTILANEPSFMSDNSAYEYIDTFRPIHHEFAAPIFKREPHYSSRAALLTVKEMKRSRRMAKVSFKGDSLHAKLYPHLSKFLSTNRNRDPEAITLALKKDMDKWLGNLKSYLGTVNNLSQEDKETLELLALMESALNYDQAHGGGFDHVNDLIDFVSKQPDLSPTVTNKVKLFRAILNDLYLEDPSLPRWAGDCDNGSLSNGARSLHSALLLMEDTGNPLREKVQKNPLDLSFRTEELANLLNTLSAQEHAASKRNDSISRYRHNEQLLNVFLKGMMLTEPLDKRQDNELLESGMKILLQKSVDDYGRQAEELSMLSKKVLERRGKHQQDTKLRKTRIQKCECYRNFIRTQLPREITQGD